MKKMKKALIEKTFTKLLMQLGLDVLDEDIKDTPKRLTKLFCDELFSSLQKDLDEPKKFYFKDDDGGEARVVCVEGIDVKTVCAHHFLPIIGHATIKYIPKGFYFGLSKFHRVVDYFCKKPQTQERLTKEIFDYFTKNQKIEFFEIEIKAVHYCVHFRGVENEKSEMTTYMSTQNF